MILILMMMMMVMVVKVWKTEMETVGEVVVWSILKNNTIVHPEHRNPIVVNVSMSEVK